MPENRLQLADMHTHEISLQFLHSNNSPARLWLRPNVIIADRILNNLVLTYLSRIIKKAFLHIRKLQNHVIYYFTVQLIVMLN